MLQSAVYFWNFWKHKKTKESRVRLQLGDVASITEKYSNNIRLSNPTKMLIRNHGLVNDFEIFILHQKLWANLFLSRAGHAQALWHLVLAATLLDQVRIIRLPQCPRLSRRLMVECLVEEWQTPFQNYRDQSWLLNSSFSTDFSLLWIRRAKERRAAFGCGGRFINLN